MKGIGGGCMVALFRLLPARECLRDRAPMGVFAPLSAVSI
jgi:hypothetical protein